MKPTLLFLFFPILTFGQDPRGLEDKRTPFPDGYSMGFPVPELNVSGLRVGLSMDSVVRKDTANFMINCGCGGKRAEPQVFVNGKEMLPTIISGLDVQHIVKISVEKEGDYADQGAIFIESRQRIKGRDFHSLATYLKSQFRDYDKRQGATYIINGTVYSNPEILLHKENDRVVFVSVSYGQEDGHVVGDTQNKNTYTITTQTAKGNTSGGAGAHAAAAL